VKFLSDGNKAFQLPDIQFSGSSLVI
jgi:hypothetical protein